MDTKEQIEYWLNLAEYDLETARVMQRTGRYLYVGFMCQQVIEKALKAAIAKIGNFPPKTHDLPRLARLGDLMQLMDKTQQQFLIELSPLNIEARYPSYKEEIGQDLNEHICMEYITQTEEMLEWIKVKLQQ